MTMRLRTLLGRPSRHGRAEGWIDQVRSRRVRFRGVLADQPGLQADGARGGLRCRGDGHRHLSDGEELRQADGAAAERGGGAVSARAMRSTMPNSGTLTPRDLNGKRVGIRSFTTTTGAWLRGILANDYGVDLDSIDWVTFEDAHVAEFRDTTKRAPAGKADHPDAARRRTRCGARREGRSPGPEAAVSGCRRGRKILVRQTQGGADQPHGGGQRGAVPETTPTRCGKCSACCSESAARAPAGERRRFSADEMRRSLE